MTVCLLAACAGGSLTASALAAPQTASADYSMTEQTAAEELHAFTVTGTATLTVDADGCEFYGSLTAVAGTLEAAEEDSETAFRKICVAFAPYGEVTERSFNVSPTRAGKGYAAYRYLTFKARLTDNAAEMRSELANAGLTEISGMTYTASDDSAYRARAIALALENAKATAAAIGAKGRLVKAEETYCYPDGYSSVGKITYTASVRAHFRKTPEPRKDIPRDNAETNADEKDRGDEHDSRNNYVIENRV